MEMIDMTGWQLARMAHPVSAVKFFALGGATVYMGLVDDRDWVVTFKAFPPTPFRGWSIIVGA